MQLSWYIFLKKIFMKKSSAPTIIVAIQIRNTKISPQPARIAIVKKFFSNFGKDCKGEETLVDFRWGCKLLKQCWCSQKSHRITAWSSNPLFGYLVKRKEVRVSKRFLHSRFIAPLIAAANMWRQFVFIDAWVKTLWDTQHARTLCLFTQSRMQFRLKKGTLALVTAWLKLEGSIWSEISQIQKAK